MLEFAKDITNAPGLVWRKRKLGYMAFWQARTDAAKKGFRPTMVALWRGESPTEADKEMIVDATNMMQIAMLKFLKGRTRDSDR